MAVSTVGTTVLNVGWTQREVDATNNNNSFQDVGILTYNYNYSSGAGTGVINEVFHQVGTISSGANLNFSLTGLSQNVLGYTINKSISRVLSMTIKNHSTISGYNIDLRVNSASGFGEPFGYPTGSLRIGPQATVHINDLTRGYTVGSRHHISLLDGGSGATYEMVILGHQ